MGDARLADGQLISTNNALGTPHEHILGQLAPGRHTLTIRVDNRLIVDVGSDSHSVTEHTQGNWNGLIGNLELRVTPLVWLEDLQVYPNVTQKSARVKVRVGNVSGQSATVQLALNVTRPDNKSSVVAKLEIGTKWGAYGKNAIGTDITVDLADLRIGTDLASVLPKPAGATLAESDETPVRAARAEPTNDGSKGR